MASRLLLVTSSLFDDESVSLGVAEELVAGWVTLHPDTVVERRNLNHPKVPHLTAEVFRSRSLPGRELGGAEIERVEAANVIVIAAPMINFGISSTLKAWIDHIVWARRSFGYTDHGPQGLLSGRVFVVSARGNEYKGANDTMVMDHVEPYLRTVLGFIGLRDLTFIPVEGQGGGRARAARGLGRARECVRRALFEASLDERRVAS